MRDRPCLVSVSGARVSAGDATDRAPQSATFDRAARLSQIRQCYLFSNAADESLLPLVQASYIRKSSAKQEIFAVGDEADGLRIILSGEVRIWLADEEGRELTLAFLGNGDAFGEVALLDGLPRTANATTTRATECLFLSAAAVERAMETDPSLAKQLIFALCELMRRNLGTISGFAFAGLEARLAQLLTELAVDHADVTENRAVFSRKFSQTDLALLLGVSREAVNKRFKSFEQEGLVATKDARLVLPDMRALAERAAQSS